MAYSPPSNEQILKDCIHRKLSEPGPEPTLENILPVELSIQYEDTSYFALISRLRQERDISFREKCGSRFIKRVLYPVQPEKTVLYRAYTPAKSYILEDLIKIESGRLHIMKEKLALLIRDGKKQYVTKELDFLWENNQPTIYFTDLYHFGKQRGKTDSDKMTIVRFQPVNGLTNHPTYILEGGFKNHYFTAFKLYGLDNVNR